MKGLIKKKGVISPKVSTVSVFRSVSFTESNRVCTFGAVSRLFILKTNDLLEDVLRNANCSLNASWKTEGVSRNLANPKAAFYKFVRFSSALYGNEVFLKQGPLAFNFLSGVPHNLRDRRKNIVNGVFTFCSSLDLLYHFMLVWRSAVAPKLQAANRSVAFNRSDVSFASSSAHLQDISTISLIGMGFLDLVNFSFRQGFLLKAHELAYGERFSLLRVPKRFRFATQGHLSMYVSLFRFF